MIFSVYTFKITSNCKFWWGSSLVASIGTLGISKNHSFEENSMCWLLLNIHLHVISTLKVENKWTLIQLSIYASVMSTVNPNKFGIQIAWLFCGSVTLLSWYWSYCLYNMLIHGIIGHSKKVCIYNFKFWRASWQSSLIAIFQIRCLFI